MIKDFCIVGFSGFLGSIARYSFYVWFGGRGLTGFPWATLSVNVLGCALVGFLSAAIAPEHRQVFLIGTVGFAGAFTTFSAFGLETIGLFRSGQIGFALLNIGANLILGMGAVLIGRMVA